MGKFTLGKHVSRELNCVHISVRDLRQAAEDNLVRQNREGPIFYADYMRKRIVEEDCERRGYVLTGFPETEEEAKALQIFGIFPEKISTLYKYSVTCWLVFLDAPNDVLKARVSGKVIDSLTKGVFYFGRFYPIFYLYFSILYSV